MASPNTLRLRNERLYDKKGHPTQLLFRKILAERRRKEWETRNAGKLKAEKAAREVETGVKDSRSATA